MAVMATSPPHPGNATPDAFEEAGHRVGEIMSRPRVLIAGGGVAGLETLLALRALAADRVDITILAPELKFVNRSMAVDQPFKRQRARGIRLAGHRGRARRSLAPWRA